MSEILPRVGVRSRRLRQVSHCSNWVAAGSVARTAGFLRVEFDGACDTVTKRGERQSTRTTRIGAERHREITPPFGLHPPAAWSAPNCDKARLGPETFSALSAEGFAPAADLGAGVVAPDLARDVGPDPRRLFVGRRQA